MQIYGNATKIYLHRLTAMNLYLDLRRIRLSLNSYVK